MKDTPPLLTELEQSLVRIKADLSTAFHEHRLSELETTSDLGRINKVLAALRVQLNELSRKADEVDADICALSHRLPSPTSPSSQSPKSGVSPC